MNTSTNSSSCIFCLIALTKYVDFFGTGSVEAGERARVLAPLVYEQTQWEIFFMQTSRLSAVAASDCFPWHRQSIKRNDKAEKYCQLPEDAQVVDFGPVPRARYPLVALLTLADEEDREIYDIVSNSRVYFRVPVFKVWLLQERGLNKAAFFPCSLEFGPSPSYFLK